MQTEEEDEEVTVTLSADLTEIIKIKENEVLRVSFDDTPYSFVMEIDGTNLKSD